MNGETARLQANLKLFADSPMWTGIKRAIEMVNENAAA